ncbi:hypothetical protein D9C73_021994 [Collichthys lucidus]|uniref:Uncharacterized protein n=1 Tax=Collichthys lucidus TaxID=240159 RepID=A0A4U5VJ71_COLLU|nr:hypothetical protein D9C73_021994 [Collichthys lucidus]
MPEGLALVKRIVLNQLRGWRRATLIILKLPPLRTLHRVGAFPITGKQQSKQTVSQNHIRGMKPIFDSSQKSRVLKLSNPFLSGAEQAVMLDVKRRMSLTLHHSLLHLKGMNTSAVICATLSRATICQVVGFIQMVATAFRTNAFLLYPACENYPKMEDRERVAWRGRRWLLMAVRMTVWANRAEKREKQEKWRQDICIEKCDEALASPLAHTAFTSSSVFSNGYAPGYAKLNRRGAPVIISVTQTGAHFHISPQQKEIGPDNYTPLCL